MALSIGIDFGTTNTVVAMAGEDGRVATAAFGVDGQASDSCRTVVTFSVEDEARPHPITVDIGPWAIRRYLADPTACRLIQSPKSYLASPLFSETRFYGRSWKLEDIVAGFLGALAERAGLAASLDGATTIAGRPVAFWGSAPDDGLAMQRLGLAYRAAGFGAPAFAYEPVAASYYFATRLTQAATVLVADLGGGTSDFSVIRYEPGPDGLAVTPLGHQGIGVGGDRLDFRIVQNAVAPLVGKGTTYRSFGRPFAVPAAYFNRIASWHEFSFLRTPEIIRDLRQLARNADEPERLGRLVQLVEGNLGFHLNHRVAAAKARLSVADEADLTLEDLGVDVTTTIRRADFEDWIAEDLAVLERYIEAAVAEAGRAAGGDIDVVFMTGGTSLVPAVRALFERRFGTDRIQAGEEFQSVAKGLALIGRAQDRGVWTLA